ncbi:MAG: hypothetical protein ACXIVD_05960 [Salinarimonas sp.]
MSDYVTFHSVDRVSPPGARRVDEPAGVEFDAIVRSNVSQPSEGADSRYDAGFEDGFAAAQQMLVQRPSGGIGATGGGRIDDTGYNMAGSLGYDPVATYFSGMPGFDPGFSGMGRPAIDPRQSLIDSGVTGAADPFGDLRERIQSLVVEQLTLRLESLVSQLRDLFSGGGQVASYPDMMTRGGVSPGNEFMRGGPGVDRLAPEMSIMPVGDHDENIRDMGDDDLLRSGSERNGALNRTAEERELNRRVKSGEGEIALNTAALSDSAVAEIYTGGSMYDMLDYAMRDPTAMRENVFGALSDLDAPDNVTTALNELFDLLDAGDEQAFINAFLNLSRTNLSQFLVPAAIDVANALWREEMGDPEVEPLPVSSADDIGEPTISTEYPDDDDGEGQEVRVFSGRDMEALAGIMPSDFIGENRDEVLDRWLAEAADADDAMEDEAA